MTIATLALSLSPPKPTPSSSSPLLPFAKPPLPRPSPQILCCSSSNPLAQTRNPTRCCARRAAAALIGAGIALTVMGPSSAAEAPSLLGSSLQLSEPSNALSLPTWAIHISSVAEWVTAMALVWRYGERPGYEAWKGLSWGMVPLLGGAMCACTWHFFYNSESLEVLVALQAALTVIGNATMCIAAFRVYKSQGRSGF
ncbi:hypothetical protein Dimus_008845 [Dionaea muscipula]